MSDLISRQDTIEKINERARETFTLAPGYEYYLGALHDVADDLRQMPTIDAVPVKHGEWIDDGGLYRCSSCNHLWSELWWTQNCPIERMLKIMPYCPNCGADMRERKADAVK